MSSLVQNHADLNGPRIIDQICFYWPWAAHTSASHSPCTPFLGALDIHRGCLANRNSCPAWRTKDFRMMFFPCNAGIQNLGTFFLRRRSIVHNLNWPEASAITYLGCMPRFVSWYSPVTDVLIARSFWVFPPFCFLKYYNPVPKPT